MPVAVCHIHRRRGVLWRDLIQSSLDPKAGYGERLVSQGDARLREEKWWATADPNSRTSPPVSAGLKTTKVQSTAESTTTARSRKHSPKVEILAAGDGKDFQRPPAAVERSNEDRDRFVTAEECAQHESRGLWGLQQREATNDRSAFSAAKRGGVGVMGGFTNRAKRAVGSLTELFRR